MQDFRRHPRAPATFHCFLNRILQFIAGALTSNCAKIQEKLCTPIPVSTEMTPIKFTANGKKRLYKTGKKQTNSHFIKIFIDKFIGFDD
ncbi:MAG TPA: hypothetical protein VN446_09000 [Candidatus Acidoferrum sp.]|nr:hypothetical protein [Candidatus Acidoferrum sp.]